MADNVIVRVPEQQFIRGEDGYSPEVTIENINHGHSVTITDRDHPNGQNFNVLDGDSAYEQAVAGGYTGTEAQFNEELASFKELSEQAANSAQQAASGASTAQYYMNSAWNAVNSANLAKASAESAADQALIRMNSAATSAQTAEDASSFFTSTILPNAVNTINSTRDQAVANVNVAKSTAVQNVQAEGATQVSAVQTESTTQQAAIQQKGEDVLESIPSDYTELTEDVDELKSAVGDITGNSKLAPVISGAYINLSGTTADINSPVSSAESEYIVIQCAEGDQFTITTHGGSSGRAYGFISSDGTILERANASVNYDKFVVTAPAGSTHLIVNAYQYNLAVYKGELIGKTVSYLESSLNGLVNDRQTAYTASGLYTVSAGYYDLNTGEAKSSNNYARTGKLSRLGGHVVRIKVDSNYKLAVRYWTEDGTFLPEKNLSFADVEQFATVEPGEQIALVFKKIDNTSITATNRTEISESLEIYTDHILNSIDLSLPADITTPLPATALEYHALWDSLVSPNLVPADQPVIVSRSAPTYMSWDTDQLYPLYTYTITPKNKYMGHQVQDDSGYVVIDGLNNIYERENILVISGQHGDEAVTPLALYTFVDRMVHDPQYAEYLALYNWTIIPLVNPYGFSQTVRTRNNRDDVNINRDYNDTSGFVTEEARYVRDVFISKQFTKCFDMHQDPLVGKSSGDLRCGFISMNDRGPATTESEYNELYRRFCKAMIKAGSITDANIAYAFGLSKYAQTTFLWKSSNEGEDTFKNYAAGLVGNTAHTDKAASLVAVFESSGACYYYSNTATLYNKRAIQYTNYWSDAAIKEFLDI